MRTLAEVLADMVQHSKDNPSHGFDCACKDGMVGEIRRMITWETVDDFMLAATYINRSRPIKPMPTTHDESESQDEWEGEP